MPTKGPITKVRAHDHTWEIQRWSIFGDKFAYWRLSNKTGKRQLLVGGPCDTIEEATARIKGLKKWGRGSPSK